MIVLAMGESVSFQHIFTGQVYLVMWRVVTTTNVAMNNLLSLLLGRFKAWIKKLLKKFPFLCVFSIFLSFLLLYISHRIVLVLDALTGFYVSCFVYKLLYASHPPFLLGF